MNNFKKAISIVITISVICSIFCTTNAAGGGRSNYTYILDPYTAYEDAYVIRNLSTGTTYNYSMTLHSVSYNGLPSGIFPSGAFVRMTMYDTLVRVLKDFSSCTTKRGPYYAYSTNVKFGLDNNSSQIVTCGISWKVG